MSTGTISINHPAFNQIQLTTDGYASNLPARLLRAAGMEKKAERLIQCDRGDLIHFRCANHGTQNTVQFSCNGRFHAECQEQNLKTAMLRYNGKLEYLKTLKGRVAQATFSMPLPERLTPDNAVSLRESYRLNIDRAARALRVYRNHKHGQVPIFSSLHCKGVWKDRQYFSLFLHVPRSLINLRKESCLLTDFLQKNGVSGEINMDEASIHMMHSFYERHLKVLEPDDDRDAAANEIISYKSRSLRPHTSVPIPKGIEPPDLFTEEESPQDVVNNSEVETSHPARKFGFKCRVCGEVCTAHVEYRFAGRLRQNSLERPVLRN